MIALIPFVQNDYVLTALYLAISIAGLIVKYEKYDALLFVVGAIAMTIFESIFISTGVETFIRNSLFGLMPLWLPVLWGYGFIVIKRSGVILSTRPVD